MEFLLGTSIKEQTSHLVLETNMPNFKHSNNQIKSDEALSNEHKIPFNKFYGSLVLLSMLPPLHSTQISPGGLSEGCDLEEKRWHRFLDSLSRLADYEPGGKTVTSVVPEKTPNGPKYWITSNFDPEGKAYQHVKWVLSELETAIVVPSSELQAFSDNISRRSIQHGWKKIGEYRRRLVKVVEKARHPSLCDTTTASDLVFSSSDDMLLKHLERMINVDCGDSEICAIAYGFRRSELMDHLSKKITGNSKSEIWTAVRHYIGQLGSWIKASKSVLQFCRRSPGCIHNFGIERLPNPDLLPADESLRKSNLRSVLEEAVPKLNVDLVERKLQKCRDSQGKSIAERFAAYIANPRFRPSVHAEIVLLEHFHSRNLVFEGPDRYIGCSKPSCYCCNLYMQHHPGRCVLRPCHGNIWPKWCPPSAVKQFEFSTNLFAPTMKNMFKDISKDLQCRLLTDIRWRERVPDSITTMSSSDKTSSKDAVIVLAT